MSYLTDKCKNRANYPTVDNAAFLYHYPACFALNGDSLFITLLHFGTL